MLITPFICAGATVQANTAKPGSADATVFNISMNVIDGGIAAGGIAGIRMDLPSTPADGDSGFQQSSSFFFYQTGTAVGDPKPYKLPKPCRSPET